jgi:hypothetical protein
LASRNRVVKVVRHHGESLFLSIWDTPSDIRRADLHREIEKGVMGGQVEPYEYGMPLLWTKSAPNYLDPFLENPSTPAA